MESFTWSNKASQYGRQDPLSMRSDHFPGHWNGTAANHDTNGQHGPALAQCGGIKGEGEASFIARPQSDNPTEQGAETARDIQVTAMISGFLFRFQIPLAQTLKHRRFFL